MPTKYEVLEQLKRDELIAAVDAAGLEVEDRRRRDLLLEALAAAPADGLAGFLGDFKRDRLKEMCRALGLDDSGREKAGIVARLLDGNGSAEVGRGRRVSARGGRKSQPANATSSLGDGATTAGTGSSPPSDRSDHAELLRQLWEAAVNLRGSIETPDYKRYVLPLIFLRFLSVRYEQRRLRLADEIREPTSPHYAESEEEAELILEDEDSYRAANVFPVPEEASWEYLRQHASADDIKIRLDQALEALEDAYPQKLKGLLPRIFAGSNLARENVTGLINLFSRDVFSASHSGADLIGQVYEYFIGGFADSEGKRGGEYFTPLSIVRTLVEMLEPRSGIVYDPCCGSGGMFVQSDAFTYSRSELSFKGQESKEFTYRLCRMNLFIHGLDGDISLGNSYFADPHTGVRADYVLANPPFNDGSKSAEGWGADRVPDKDPRLKLGDAWMSLARRNANTMWILHFFYHLKEGGTAGFVMATGELSNSETARLAVRRALIEEGYVDCIVQLTGQLFANTQIPCSLWFLSKNRGGTHGYRKREDEILFIDGRKLGSLIPGSRKQKSLADPEIERIASVYREFKRERRPEAVPGFCEVATVDDVKENRWALTPGRYVGTEEVEDGDEPFEERFPALLERLEDYFMESRRLEGRIRECLEKLPI